MAHPVVCSLVSGAANAGGISVVLPVLPIIHFYPIKALITTTKATTTKATVICLTDTAAGAGNIKKLKLLSHAASYD